MSFVEEIYINLDLPPSDRWHFLKNHIAEIDVMIGYYLQDLGDVSFFQDAIDYYKVAFVQKEYLEEIKSLASLSRFSENEILITNLYYDALKFVFGCTAFAIQNQGQSLHARNLDWWTENNALKKHTKIFHFTRNNQILYSAVSWIGFIGILSGMKPGKFSVTLNAVSSTEAPHLAPPVTFLIRETLEKAESYAEACRMLSETEIASDCLLMLVGTEPGERIVIERTPRHYAHRHPKDDILIVTNNYRTFTSDVKTGDVLQQSSCGRFEQTETLLKTTQPRHEEACFTVLSHPNVKMGITVQQMVFNLTTNTITVR